MKVYLVSLGRVPERRDHMVRQFSKLGFDYQIVDAVDGKDPADMFYFTEDRHAFSKIYGRHPRPGEAGCYFSHLKALEQFLSDGQDYGCVMEDDLDISKAYDQAMELYQVQLAEMGHYDLFYPGWPPMDGFERVSNLSEEHAKEHVLRLDAPPVGTQCYFVSSRFASFIADNFKVFYRPIDELYRSVSGFRDHGFTFYMAKPEYRWVGQGSFKSEVLK